jgi:hypothetical protein
VSSETTLPASGTYTVDVNVDTAEKGSLTLVLTG